MNTVVVASDVISALAFLAAAVIAGFARFDTPLVSKSVRYTFVGAMSLYAFVGVSNVLEHAGITAAFDVYEDFAEILFVPALAYVSSTMFKNYQLDEQLKAARRTRQQNDLLLNIVDTVPGGILVVGPAGSVVFANQGAEQVLGMASDQGNPGSIEPNWALVDPATQTGVTLAQLASREMVRRPLVAHWPDGTQAELVVSSSPMAEKSGVLGGSVVAFEVVAARG